MPSNIYLTNLVKPWQHITVPEPHGIFDCVNLDEPMFQPSYHGCGHWTNWSVGYYVPHYVELLRIQL